MKTGFGTHQITKRFPFLENYRAGCSLLRNIARMSTQDSLTRFMHCQDDKQQCVYHGGGVTRASSQLMCY